MRIHSTLFIVVTIFFVLTAFGSNHTLIITPNAGIDFVSGFKDLNLRNFSLIIPNSDCLNTQEKTKLEKKLYQLIEEKEYFNFSVLWSHIRKLHKDRSINRIIITSESDVLRAAEFRKRLKIEGQNISSANAFRNKILMKQMVSSNKIYCPEFSKISTKKDIEDFILKNGYPVIIKPVNLYGSQNLHIIKTLQDFLKLEIPEPFEELEVENFVQGDMYHVDGLIDKDKKIILWPSKFIRPPVQFLNRKTYGSFTISDNNPLFNRIKDYTIRVLSSLPSKGVYGFHLEFFHDLKNNKFIFCEIASRIGGMNINSLWKYSFSTDPEILFLRLQNGINLKNIELLQKEIVGRIMFPIVRGTLVKIPKNCPFDWVEEYITYIKEGLSCKKATSIDDVLLSIVFTAKTEKELTIRYKKLEEWIYGNIKWKES
jgi:hypothetical protein